MKNLYLTTEEINKAFHGVQLEENYNFLEDDLVKLANAFLDAAAPNIIMAEREACIEFVRSLNTTVAEALTYKRQSPVVSH